jgi:cytochrome c oxidase cbb3-type subunit 1
VPRLTNREWPSSALIRWHFWLTAVGVLVYWIALTVGGVEQGLRVANPNIAFLDVVRGTIPWLEMRSVAGVAMTLGQLCFLASIIWLLARRPGAETGPTLLGPEPLSPDGDVVRAT